MKTALYLRVSTDEQTLSSQRVELRRVCRLRGWREVEEYSDTISGSRMSRAGLDRLMADVRKGRIARIVCYKLDRLGRSVQHMVQIIAEMTSNKVALVVPGQGIDTTADSPSAAFQLHILVAVAEFERELIRDRTRMGLKAARERGSVLGRPKGPPHGAINTVAALIRENAEITVREIAQHMRVSAGTAHAWKKMAMEGGR